MNETKILENMLDMTKDIKNISKMIVLQQKINNDTAIFTKAVLKRFRIQNIINLGLCVVIGLLYHQIHKSEQEKK